MCQSVDGEWDLAGRGFGLSRRTPDGACPVLDTPAGVHQHNPSSVSLVNVHRALPNAFMVPQLVMVPSRRASTLPRHLDFVPYRPLGPLRHSGQVRAAAGVAVNDLLTADCSHGRSRLLAAVYPRRLPVPHRRLQPAPDAKVCSPAAAGRQDWHG